MGFTLISHGDGFVVRSHDDRPTFDSILDRFEDHPRLRAARLALFCEDHPRHLEATTHLASLHSELGDTAVALRWAGAAREVLVEGLGEIAAAPLDPAHPANRVLLRCARNATLVAWSASSWELAAELAALRARIDTSGDAHEWAARISSRLPVGAPR